MAAVLVVALPGALSGGVLAAIIDGDLLSIGTLVGFLVVLGLAARNSVLFAQRCHQLEDAAMEGFSASSSPVPLVSVWRPL